MFSHQPTWNDCQQMLQMLFTTELNISGADGWPTQQQNEINMEFPLTRPGWDYSMAEGRENLKIYHQALVAGASRLPMVT